MWREKCDGRTDGRTDRQTDDVFYEHVYDAIGKKFEKTHIKRRYIIARHVDNCIDIPKCEYSSDLDIKHAEQNADLSSAASLIHSDSMRMRASDSKPIRFQTEPICA